MTRNRRRAGAAAAGTGLALAVLTAAAGLQPGAGSTAARADVVTVSQDNLRTGWDPAETAMTPAQVPSFTQLFKTAVNGQVYAQPLVVGSTVIVATETDQVYGLNAQTGAITWQTSLGTPYHITTCSDLSPDIGVTGTPVYDAAAGADGTVYMFAQTASGWALYGLDPVTGAITSTAPIGGSPSNDANITFSPDQQLQRTGLLLMNGWVYGAFGSHCDTQPYAGYVAGVNVATGATTLWTDEAGVSNDQAGIWQGGGGVMSDGSGRIFVTSGNGISPPTGPGTSPPGQLAESVIRLAPDSVTGTLSAQDFFSPSNAPSLDSADRDFGAGGPVGLPFGTSSYPHLLAQAGKDGRIFLLNRDNLGGRNKGGQLFQSTSYGGEWGHPAVFADTSTLTAANAAAASDYLYFVGKSSPLRVFKFGVDSTGKPTLSDVANSSLTFGYTSGSPVVTSTGTNAATAVLWEVYASAGTGKGGVLEAYNVSSTALAGCSSGTPCSLSPIFSAPIGTAAKFTVPATNGGDVYVGTRDGHVYGFGPPAAAPAAGASTAFGQAAVGSSVTRTVSMTASRPVTVTGVTAQTGASNAAAPASQFSVGRVTRDGRAAPVTFPVTLARGDRLSAAVTFAPAAAGGADGSLSFATTSARFPAVSVPMAGSGTQAGLTAAPSAVSFPLAPDQGVTDVPVGITSPQIVDLTNYGTTADTVTSVTPPAGAFTATGLPAPGTVIKPGASIPVQVTFAPRSAGPASGSFTVAGTAGPAATVSLSGVGTAAVSKVTAASPSVRFGTVRVGHQATAYIHVTNAGNTTAVVTGTAPLPEPFGEPLRAEAELPFNPSYDLWLPVSFTPRKAGRFTATYQLSWKDLHGRHALAVSVSGTASR